MLSSMLGMGLSGTAASGGLAGAMPFIGAGVGAGSELMNQNEQKKAREREESNPNSPNYRPKHRRMTEIQNALNQYREQKLSGQLTLAQSAFDWANSLRG